MRTLHGGDHGADVAHLQKAINTRLEARAASALKVKTDGVFGPKTREALISTCYLLGLESSKIKGLKTGGVDPREQRFVYQPGRRSDHEKMQGRNRVRAHRAAVKRAEARAHASSEQRKRIVNVAKEAAANYRKNPGAYHYLAGGIANTEIMKPTPSSWRSDCSMFVASCYKDAGVESPAAPLDHQWAATSTIVKSPHARITNDPKPGDLGMYGARTGDLHTRYTHHVELFVGEPGVKFIGHGSPPIDSFTPGEPDFYVTFDFLD